MAASVVEFVSSLSTTDPQKHPVLIVGQLKYLNKLRFQDVKCKLEPRVTEETFLAAIASLHPAPTDSCSLYLNLATVAALPIKCSRHNTSARVHALTKLVRNSAVGVDETIIVVCEKNEVFASACAIAKAFPLYTTKTFSNDGSGNSAPQTPPNVFVYFLTTSDNIANVESSLTANDLKCLNSASFGVRLAAKIVDMPCNFMNVSGFLAEVDAIRIKTGATLTLFRGSNLEAKGMGGIYGVGKAANDPPALAVLSHYPKDATSTVAWVGKGIVYDTGGLSIKGKTAMPGMKRDCGGAAAVLGAFYTAVTQGFNQNLHAVFCLAENSVGPNATRPDDIHTLYSGRTVEINNTDAEGRLVLSDGVVFAQKDLKANIIVDIATLTGAQGVATGKYHAAVLTNNEDWEDATISAGRACGDLVFPIPYCPELHFTEFASAVADMKNSVADRNNAQSSCAGLFIASHLGFDWPGVWIHVDMACPVHCGERATGYGVALLNAMFGHMSTDSTLQSLSSLTNVNGEEENACKKLRRK